jgi:putative ABC transport system substrate-binding protein
LSPNLRAQGQVTTRRIGFLSAFARADMETFLGLLRPELEKLGWTDGRNIVLLEPRTTSGDNARLPSVATELVALGPDLILVQSVPATRALMQAAKSIPIVMVGVVTPVELGIVADYRKPGGNVTGSSYLADESARKLLQFLKEAAPRLRSVAVFANPSNEAAAPFVKQMRADAVGFGMQAQIVEVSGKGDFEAAFAAIRSANTQSILLPSGTADPIQPRRNRELRADSRVAAGHRGQQSLSSDERSDLLRANVGPVRAKHRPLRRPDFEGRQTR